MSNPILFIFIAILWVIPVLIASFRHIKHYWVAWGLTIGSVLFPPVWLAAMALAIYGKKAAQQSA